MSWASRRLTALVSRCCELLPDSTVEVVVEELLVNMREGTARQHRTLGTIHGFVIEQRALHIRSATDDTTVIEGSRF